jgi:prepilin-type N-terminal cleavage/methylation domain-containing protein
MTDRAIALPLPHRWNGGKWNGFTLVEVIAALALFAIATIGLAGAYIDVLNGLERVKVDQQLEQELAFVRTQVLLQPDLDEVELGGDVPTATHGEARWTATVTPSERVADLFRVDLEIEFTGDGEAVPPGTFEETLYLLRPDWSEPTARDDIRVQRKKEIEEAKLYRAR